MSNTGIEKKNLLDAMRHVWALGGVRRYYRGLTVRAEPPPMKSQHAHLVSRSAWWASSRTSIPPSRAMPLSLTAPPSSARRYSAIDMSTFEALKQAYQRSTGTEEPGVLALLAFGSISGSVGATSVYPLNLVRTRLQASGSSGHPQTYTGPWDVAAKTWAADGWRGFYRGLFPTLAKVRWLKKKIIVQYSCQLVCRLFPPCPFLMLSMSIQNEGLFLSYACLDSVANAHTDLAFKFMFISFFVVIFGGIIAPSYLQCI